MREVQICLHLLPKLNILQLSPLIHVMLGVVEPHANLDGVALPDPLEDVLHGLALKSLLHFNFPLEDV